MLPRLLKQVLTDRLGDHVESRKPKLATNLPVLSEREGVLAKIYRYSSKLVELLSFADVAAAVIVRSKARNIMLDKASRPYPRRNNPGIYISLLRQLSQELNTRRISSVTTRSLIRSHFRANLRFSATLCNPSQHGDFTARGADVAVVPTRERLVKVRLAYNPRFGLEEGDYILSLDFHGAVLHFFTFSFCEGREFGLGSGSVIVIGGNQGASPKLRELRARIVRDCHDIAPEDVLLLGAIGLARRLGCTHVLCIGTGIHSIKLNSSRYDRLKSHLRKSYDQCWQTYPTHFMNGYYVLQAAADPISFSAPNGTHKGRKLKKREVKRVILERAGQGLQLA